MTDAPDEPGRTVPDTLEAVAADFARSHRRVTGLPSRFLNARRDPAYPEMTGSNSPDGTRITFSAPLSDAVTDAYHHPDPNALLQGHATFVMAHELFHAADKDLTVPSPSDSWPRSLAVRARRLANEGVTECATQAFLPEIIDGLTLPDSTKQMLRQATDGSVGYIGIADVARELVELVTDDEDQFRTTLIDWNRTPPESLLEFGASRMIDRSCAGRPADRDRLQFHTAALLGAVFDRAQDVVDHHGWGDDDIADTQAALNSVATFVEEWGRTGGPIRGWTRRYELDAVAVTHLAELTGLQARAARSRMDVVDADPEYGRNKADFDEAYSIHSTAVQQADIYAGWAQRCPRMLFSTPAKQVRDALAQALPPDPVPARAARDGDPVLRETTTPPRRGLFGPSDVQRPRRLSTRPPGRHGIGR